MSPRIRAVRLVIAALFGLIALVFAPTADAYVNQNPYDVHLSGPGQAVPCTGSAQIHATVRSATTGNLWPLQTVFWDIKSAQSSGDRLSNARTTTANDGTTSVTLTFGAATGPRVVRAKVGTWPTTITVTCSGAVNAPPTPHPTPRATPRATQAPAGATPRPTPRPTAVSLPGTDAAVPALPSQGPDLWPLVAFALAGSVALLLLRRRSRS